MNMLTTATELPSPSPYGAVGDGSTDDSQAFTDCLSERGILWLDPYKSYYVPGFKPLPNTAIIGNGAIMIGGVLGNDNVRCHGVKFITHETDGVAPFKPINTDGMYLEDCRFIYLGTTNQWGCVYANDSFSRNIKLVNCSFKAPNSATNGIKLVGKNDSDMKIEGWDIINPVITEVGRMGIEVQSDTLSDGDYGYENIKVRGGSIENCGSHGYGMGVSYTGYGINGEVSDVYFSNNVGYSVENVGCQDMVVQDNKFNNMINDLISFSNTRIMKRNIIRGNRTLEGRQNQRVYITNIEDSEVSDNFFWLDTDSFIVNGKKSRVFDNFVDTKGKVAMLLENCDDCDVYRNNLKTTEDNWAVLRLMYQGCQNNRVYDNNLKKGNGGVYYDEVSGAFGNHFFNNLEDNVVES